MRHRWIPPRHVPDGIVMPLAIVVAAIAMDARALARGKVRPEPEAVRGGGRYQTVKCRHARIRQGIQGTAHRSIVERLGFDPRGDAPTRRFVLKAHRHAVE
jgi:hypothetical protein